MIYKEGMLCKHFKGKNLLEKNIYRIIKTCVNWKDIDQTIVTYTGDNTPEMATDLVLYQNIFQDEKYFVREYSDISKELSDEKKTEFDQVVKVQPLTEEEIKTVMSEEFQLQKREIESQKHKSR